MDIRKQIKNLDGLLYSIKKSTNWGKEYGTYAPLERQVNELKDTMEKLLAVCEAAEAIGGVAMTKALSEALARYQTCQQGDDSG
jgi:hypothetical protein